MGKKRDFVTFIKCGQYSDIAELKALSDAIFGFDSITLKEFRRYYYHHTPISYYIAVKKKPPFQKNDKGQIIGFLIYQFMTEKETEELVPNVLEKTEFSNNVPSLRILKIGIMEEHRNKNIGKHNGSSPKV